jgi:hypothetical protein
VKGFKEKENQKEPDDLSDKFEKNDLEMISEELTETFKEDIIITKLQKFSIAKFLYKVECVQSQLETKILVNNYDKSYYKVESKINLNSDFERKLAQNLSEVSNNTVSLELFAAIIETMKSCSAVIFRAFDPSISSQNVMYKPEESDMITDLLNQKKHPDLITIPFEKKIKNPFVPSPRASGFCWSPHGYIVHFRSSHMTEEN